MNDIYPLIPICLFIFFIFALTIMFGRQLKNDNIETYQALFKSRKGFLSSERHLIRQVFSYHRLANVSEKTQVYWRWFRYCTIVTIVVFIVLLTMIFYVVITYEELN